jgi:hypothetical protein
MPRASTVVKLVLLGSTLALIGLCVYATWEDGWFGARGYHGGYYQSHGWFYSGGGYSGSSPTAPSGVTTRGGFGGSGFAGGGE